VGKHFTQPLAMLAMDYLQGDFFQTIRVLLRAATRLVQEALSTKIDTMETGPMVMVINRFQRQMFLKNQEESQKIHNLSIERASRKIMTLTH
jgi:hypothetical protein